MLQFNSPDQSQKSAEQTSTELPNILLPKETTLIQIPFDSKALEKQTQELNADKKRFSEELRALEFNETEARLTIVADLLFPKEKGLIRQRRAETQEAFSKLTEALAGPIPDAIKSRFEKLNTISREFLKEIEVAGGEPIRNLERLKSFTSQLTKEMKEIGEPVGIFLVPRELGAKDVELYIMDAKLDIVEASVPFNFEYRVEALERKGVKLPESLAAELPTFKLIKPILDAKTNLQRAKSYQENLEKFVQRTFDHNRKNWIEGDQIPELKSLQKEFLEKTELATAKHKERLKAIMSSPR